MFTKAKASQTNVCHVNYFFVAVNSTGNVKTLTQLQLISILSLASSLRAISRPTLV